MAKQKTVGSVRLEKEAEKLGSIRALAKSLGQDFAAVWRWIRATRKPEYKKRKVLEDSLGIPMDAWDKPSTEVSP